MLFSLLIQAAHAADEAGGGGFTLTEIWQHSGYLARGVIAMLVFMLLATIVTGIERLIAFSRARNQSMALASKIVAPLQSGDVDAALALTKNEEYAASYLASLLRAGLGELSIRQDKHGLAAAERAVEKSINEEVAKTRRGMTILATVGSTAPFVGLFGTTFGVINAFQGMSSGGSGLASISAGISEALITTGVGIGVAVIGVWVFNYFNARIEKVNEELASSEADFIDWANKLLVERQEAAAKAGK